MKKTVFTLLIFVFAMQVSFAQTEKYTEAMKSALRALHQSMAGEPKRDELLGLANRFERIASAEPTQWLPRYYAAYCYSSLGFMGEDMLEKDQMSDKADAFLKEAEALTGESSELWVMKAQVQQARLAADPMSRWQTYGTKFEESLAKATALDPNNPRIYTLRGTTLLYTPDQFGGGKKMAKPVLEKALEKYAEFRPETELHPGWGKEQAAWMLSQCN
ncbi:hypothetical protein [Arundinibacter roseus]|uniref:Tetratricopeptide repeat protein n=1 Tax=Arundinibacter roseus TaxID=2070510 RepID=A0A4V2X9E6_9BACT|nr:hypothetical protein [Arundinibacter roseus]TDB63415.1 hypothetical protein EZE20_16765 [Arundinibacter roseus]